VFPGADYEEIRTGKPHVFPQGAVLPNVAHFTNEACSGNLADPFDRKKTIAVGNLLEMMTLFLF
jgi:hypothetical protein